MENETLNPTEVSEEPLVPVLTDEQVEDTEGVVPTDVAVEPAV